MEQAALSTRDYDYDLPEELIAQSPLARRDASRLMVLRGDLAPEHRHFDDILDYLRPGDRLVVNNTKVIPARLLGYNPENHAPLEFLLLERLDEARWEIIGKPGKRLKVGKRAVFIPGRLEAEVEAVKEDGNRIVRFDYQGIWEEILDEAGEMPLPPYIHEKLQEKDRYQTVYAKFDGSAAAPTAGLHFTKELLEKVKAAGIGVSELTLHVGLGTFRPVKAENIAEHQMHSEKYILDAATAAEINATKQAGGRIIAVGTTSCRVLETVADPETGLVQPQSGSTQIFIYPPYRFKILDGLITNFHLPQSTLLMLVSAFMGRERMLAAYAEAVRERYRFFSFGDAMLLLPRG